MITQHRRMLRAKLHGATVTDANIEYEGSVSLAPRLLEAADIREFEEVQVWNVTTGARFSTYAITGDNATNACCINGSAAHHASAGDTVIIACFVDIPEQKLHQHKPKLVFLDKDNQVKAITSRSGQFPKLAAVN